MSLHPAGLSSDSIDVNLASSSPPPSLPFDQWSDTHETAETDDERDIQEVVPHPEDLSVGTDKVTTDDKPLEIQAPSPANLSPNVPEHTSDADAASVQSMPIVQVTEPTSPVPMSAQSHSSGSSATLRTSLVPPGTSPHRRRTQHRVAQETRASNRLSGFFSSLIHRRDVVHPTTPEASTPTSPLANSSSPGSSPAPSRPSTPPPRLAPPSLNDLGLTLSSLTSHISSSHANGPPASGAFLKPHYLLLCHSQGLDVLPLVSPPAPQPYALIRRVAFKSVVVMEHRGVLVAIAGRRNGVRVYALEDIKRAVEWRIEAEVRREQERARREEAKRGPGHSAGATIFQSERRGSVEKMREKLPLSTAAIGAKGKSARRSSISVATPGPPRMPTTKRPKTAEGASQSPSTPTPMGPPPAYTSSVTPPRGLEHATVTLAQTRSRATSLSDVLAGTLSRRHTADFHVERGDEHGDDSKADWASSDDEAINVVAAPSGSQALDERTSSMVAVASPGAVVDSNARIDMNRSQTAPSLHRRNRPANLDLSLTRTNSRTSVSASPPPPSPTPTLLTLRQALSLPSQSNRTLSSMGSLGSGVQDADGDGDEEDDGDPDPSSPTTPTRERISLAEALMESRLPDLPPAGTRREQTPILIGATVGQEENQSSPRTSESGTTHTRRSTGDQSNRRRRRWSVLDGIFTHSPSNSNSSITPLQEGLALDSAASSTDGHTSEMRERTDSHMTPSSSALSRSHSTRITPSDSGGTVRPEISRRPSTSPGRTGPSPHGLRDRAATIGDAPPLPSITPSNSTTSRFIPRIITNAFQSRRSDDVPAFPRSGDVDAKRANALPPPPPAPAPKLEYAKLPGTKGAVLIKAVETARKSFLAILCGETGEKVELFAGTYRTALQLSRTFILPDSPRSLELQLQGDDLVEVFLVFTQNVFGLEPATVRVREVRIGRAERRAARRRARGNRSDQPGEGDENGAGAGEDDTTVNVTVLSPSSPAGAEDSTVSPTANEVAVPPQLANASQTQLDSVSMTANSTEELLTLAAAQNSPYTTFQQLTFAPNFPLAAIADEYIIPPTYASFLEYRSSYEPEVNGDMNVDLSQVQFSPPGLPVPTPGPPSRWFYRDPKGVIHGPWKATLMQAWYRDGLLPPDLPVRREEDLEYTLLKHLRLQCIDPTHPFRSATPLPPSPSPPLPGPDASKPLLCPISLLSQPRHFGPPALFYSSRGGHSTTIVDARGRSVLKGRFLWSSDEDAYSAPAVRLGDVKRLEAFDVEDRAVLVAMRQGGLEVVDFGDALLRPADHSRTVYPHFQPPPSSVSRRGPYVWRIGTPLTPHPPVSSLPSIPSSVPTKSAGQRKKTSTGPTKSPRSDYALSSETDSDRMQDEVLFLGRKDDEIYLCERRITSFRILRLSLSDAAPST